MTWNLYPDYVGYYDPENMIVRIYDDQLDEEISETVLNRIIDMFPVGNIEFNDQYYEDSEEGIKKQPLLVSTGTIDSGRSRRT